MGNVGHIHSTTVAREFARLSKNGLDQLQLQKN